MYICIFFHHVFCCLCLKVMFCFSGPQEWSWCRHSLQRQSSWRDFSWNGHVDHKYSNFRCENSFVSERLFFLFVNFVCILLVCHVISCCSPFSWRNAWHVFAPLCVCVYQSSSDQMKDWLQCFHPLTCECRHLCIISVMGRDGSFLPVFCFP